MDLNQLSAWAQHNKAALGIAGAGGVVVLALARRKSSSGTPATGGATGTTAYAAGGQTAGMTGGVSTAGYDSTASDLYSSLQSQIEAMGQSAQPSASTIPTPAPPAYAPGFYRRAGGHAIYQENPNGTIDWLSAAEARDLITPGTKITPVAIDSPFWQQPGLDKKA